MAGFRWFEKEAHFRLKSNMSNPFVPPGRKKERAAVLDRLEKSGSLDGFNFGDLVSEEEVGALLADCIITYNKKERTARKAIQELGPLEPSRIGREIKSIHTVLASPRVGPELRVLLKQHEMVLTEVELKVAEQIADLRTNALANPESKRKERLSKLFLSLYAIRRLLVSGGSGVDYVGSCIRDILHGMGMDPPPGKKRKDPQKRWNPDSIRQYIKRLGGSAAADCVAACLFSTEETLKQFTPSHKFLAWKDNGGCRAAVIAVFGSSKPQVMTLHTHKELEALTNPVLNIADLPEFDPESAHRIKPRKQDRERVLKDTGLVLFRSLPLDTSLLDKTCALRV